MLGKHNEERYEEHEAAAVHPTPFNFVQGVNPTKTDTFDIF